MKSSSSAQGPDPGPVASTQAKILEFLVMNDEPRIVTPWQRHYGWFLMDVLTYILVLNLAAELVDDIKMEHFSISIFVAVVLKLIMNAIQYLEHEIQHFFCVRLERKVIGAFFMWLVVFSSKFLFLWLDDVIFGEQVELGYIWEIIILSAVLIVSEKLNRLLFFKLGDVYRARHPDEGDEDKNEVKSTLNAEDTGEIIDQGTKEEEKEP